MLNTTFLKSAWEGLTFEKGKFSTKKTAYVVSVCVTSWVITHYTGPVTWDLMTAYALHCTGPSALREFLNYKTRRNEVVADTITTVADKKTDE